LWIASVYSGTVTCQEIRNAIDCQKDGTIKDKSVSSSQIVIASTDPVEALKSKADIPVMNIYSVLRAYLLLSLCIRIGI
jgi:hypothetical protein